MTVPISHFGRVEKSVLSDQIAERILQMIRDRQLGPGDKLPPERELATMMNVSRPALREALRGLSMMNIIEIRQGAGAYVTTLEPAQLVQHLDFVFALDDSTLLELFDARKIVEVGLTELAAQRITDEDIERLEQSLALSVQCVDDPELFLQADLDLHMQIAQIARNPILARFMESIHQLGIASRRRTARLDGVTERSTADHRRIVAALKARDVAGARQAMLDHLANVEAKLRLIAQSTEFKTDEIRRLRD
jgi:GntR family transcriptional regulator, transcriptional repressor for pyruvate dehydrogenase complex